MKSTTTLSACLLVTASLLAASLQAAPTVSGKVISLPDDGWYQVQSKADYTSICQGVRQCEVDAGDYIVINHTTGERFEISVSDESNASAVSVVGNTISWPNDGWYQVQNAADYSSVCQGGRSCEVDPGTYNVINLTTGKRFTNIVVGEDGGGDQPTDRILGFGDHRLGEDGFTNENIDIITQDKRYFGNANESFLLSVFHEQSVITTYFSESMARHISRVVEQASSVQQAQDVLEDGNDSSTFTRKTITTNSVFDCDAGGTMSYKSSATLVYGPDNSPFEGTIVEDNLKQEFDFSECHSVYAPNPNAQPGIRSNVYPYGEYAMNGQYVVELYRNGTPTKNPFFSVDHSWDNLSVLAEAPSQWSIIVDGKAKSHQYATSTSGEFTDISSNYSYVYTGASGQIQEQMTSAIPLQQ